MSPDNTSACALEAKLFHKNDTWVLKPFLIATAKNNYVSLLRKKKLISWLDEKTSSCKIKNA